MNTDERRLNSRLLRRDRDFLLELLQALPGCDFLGRGQTGHVEIAANGLDQRYARHHAARQKLDRGLLIRQSDGLRRDDLKISGDAALVLIDRQLQRSLGRGHRRRLLLGFILQYAQRGKIVLYVLKGGQDALAIGGNRGIVGCLRLFEGALAFPEIEQRVRYRRTQRPEAAGPGEQIDEAGSFEAGGGADSDVGIERGLSYANLRIGRGHATLIRRDIGTPLEKLGRQAYRDRRRRCIDYLERNGELGGSLADDNRDGMLVLGSLHQRIGRLGARLFELGARLHHIDLRSD